MALATATVTVPFPAGVVATTLAGTLQGVCLKTPPFPRAELQVLVAADQAAAADYRPVMVNGQPLSLPISSGGFIPFPQNLVPPLAKVQIAVTNAGAACDVDLTTS